MKRNIKILSLIWALLIFSSFALCFASCDNSDNDEGKYELLYDFEQGLYNVRMNSNFGVITLNEEKDYVASGNKSARLDPNKTIADPFMYLPMESSLLTFSHINLKKISEFTFKIYSTSNTTINVGLYFSNNADLKCAPTQFSVEKGWNTIKYKPNYSVIMIQYSLDDFKGIYIGTAGIQANAPTLYLDDVAILESDINIEIDNLIILKKTSDYFEICDFENAYQNLVFVSKGNGNISTIEVVNSSERIQAPSGKKMLKVVLHEKSGTGTSWSQVFMVPSLIEAINFSQFKGHTDEYEFKFNVMRDFDENTESNGTFDTLVEINAYYTSYGNMDWGGITLFEKNVWYEYSVPMTNYSNFCNNQGDFAFAFVDKKAEGEYTYYFDNFRIERKK